MTKNSLYAVFALLAGIFTIAGAVFNWDWFMNNYRARFFVWLFGRIGARIFYVLLGFVIIYLGLMLSRF